jgi:hypothetical protein
MKSISLLNIVRFSLLLTWVIATPKNVAPQTTTERPLVFRIIAEDSSLASGSKFLPIDVEFHNTSKHLIRFSPAGIGAEISFVNRPCSLEEGVRSQGSSADSAAGLKGKIISVRPGETYWQKIRLRLDPNFFTPGIYSVTVFFSGGYGTYGMKGVYAEDLRSNEIFFEIAERLDNAAAVSRP